MLEGRKTPSTEIRKNARTIFHDRACLASVLAKSMFKDTKVQNIRPLAEINRGGWAAGYGERSLEHLKAHRRHQVAPSARRRV